MTFHLHRFSAAVIAVCAMASTAHAQMANYRIPAGDMEAALSAYIRQSGVQLIFKVDDVRGLTTKGLSGSFSSDEALTRLLEGTPLRVRREGADGMAVYLPSPAGASAESEPPVAVVSSTRWSAS